MHQRSEEGAVRAQARPVAESPSGQWQCPPGGRTQRAPRGEEKARPVSCLVGGPDEHAAKVHVFVRTGNSPRRGTQTMRRTYRTVPCGAAVRG